MIIVFGGGVVSNVVLSKTKGNNSGWIVISLDGPLESLPVY